VVLLKIKKSISTYIDPKHIQMIVLLLLILLLLGYVAIHDIYEHHAGGAIHVVPHLLQ
jgi:hypothetical protein